MTAANWTAEELDRIGGAEELEIAPQRHDGSSRRPLPIWVDRVDEGWSACSRSSYGLEWNLR
jgi:hypothetical protein